MTLDGTGPLKSNANEKIEMPWEKAAREAMEPKFKIEIPMVDNNGNKTNGNENKGLQVEKGDTPVDAVTGAAVVHKGETTAKATNKTVSKREYGPTAAQTAKEKNVAHSEKNISHASNTTTKAPEQEKNWFDKAWDGMWEWANETPEDPTVGDYAVRTGKQAVAVVGSVLLAGGSLVFGGLYGCSPKGNTFYHEDVEITSHTSTKTDTIPGTPGTPGTDPIVNNGVLTEEGKAQVKAELLKDTITAKNNENPKTSDGVGYKYTDNGNGTGSVVIKNKNGSDSGIKLGFSTSYDIAPGTTDPNTGDYSTTVTMSASATSTITDSNIVEYIGIVGEKPKTSAGDEYTFTIKGGKVQTTYGDTGFTHKYGESATVTANSPLGKAQSILTDLGILPEMGGKIATETQTSEGAWGTGKGVHFEVVPGDLKEVTTGNPTVKMAFNDMQGNKITVEGKLEKDGNGVKITDKNGKVLRIQPQTVNISDEDYTGVSVSYDGTEVFRLAKDTFNGKQATILAHVDFEDGEAYTDTDTFFTPNAPKAFDGKTAATESDAYFDVKKQNLTDAYNAAVDGLKGTKDVTVQGSVTPGNPGTPGTEGYIIVVKTHTESGSSSTVHH